MNNTCSILKLSQSALCLGCVTQNASHQQSDKIINIKYQKLILEKIKIKQASLTFNTAS